MESTTSQETGAAMTEQRIKRTGAVRRAVKPKAKKGRRFWIVTLICLYHLAGLVFYATGAVQHIQHLFALKVAPSAYFSEKPVK